MLEGARKETGLLFHSPIELVIEPNEIRSVVSTEWYSKQIKFGVNSRNYLNRIEVKAQFTVLKPPHACLVVEYYNFMNSLEGKNIINGGRSAVIIEAINLGTSKLRSFDPFEDVDPWISVPSTHKEEEYISMQRIESAGLQSANSRLIDNEIWVKKVYICRQKVRRD